MYLCTGPFGEDHEEICHENLHCPLCAMRVELTDEKDDVVTERDSLQGQVNDLEDEKSNLQERVENLGLEADGLRQDLADATGGSE